MKLKKQIKAISIAAGDKGVLIQNILDFFEIGLTDLVRLVNDINSENDVLVLKIIGRKLYATLNSEYADLLKNFNLIQESKLSNSLQETLAIIAYLSPCRKSEIDFIRGVDSSHSVDSLIELGFVDKRDEHLMLSDKILARLQISDPSELPNYESLRQEFHSKLQNLKI